MVGLDQIVIELDNFFDVRAFDPDPAFSTNVPKVYESIDFPWKSAFEDRFVQLFNGLMIRGAESVTSIFPSSEALKTILSKANKGDVIFTHHALDMRCGTPHYVAEGFIPIDPKLIERIKEKQISLYSCHAPLDVHPSISTTGAIVEALKGEKTGEFLPYGKGFAGAYCTIQPITLEVLCKALEQLFAVSWLDIGGRYTGEAVVEKIAVVAGGGDRAHCMVDAEREGCQAYITGHIRHYTNQPVYEQRRREVEEYFDTSKIACIGVSHGASESLVMRQNITQFFRKAFSLPVVAVEEKNWWR
jgi:putative NIF3 family GTP cyclohydrolase 1 type 2